MKTPSQLTASSARVRVRRRQRILKRSLWLLVKQPWLLALGLLTTVAAASVPTILSPAQVAQLLLQSEALADAVAPPPEAQETRDQSQNGVPVSVQEWVLGKTLAQRTWERNHLSCTAAYESEDAESTPVFADGGFEEHTAPLLEDFNQPGPTTARGALQPQPRLITFSALSADPFGGQQAGAALVVSDPFSGAPIGGSGGSSSLGSGSGSSSGSFGNTTSSSSASADDEMSADAGDTQPTVVGDGDVLGGVDPISGGLILEAGGLLIPGDSPGILRIDGDFEVDEDSVTGVDNPRIEIEIAGTGEGEFDRIEVVGQARIAGGTLDIIFIDDFVPDVGDLFEFLFATGGIVDDENHGPDELDFTVTGLGPDLDYDIVFATHSITLEILAGLQQLQTQALQDPSSPAQTINGPATAPAPATWSLFLAGGLLLAARRRRG